jgi:hypothetical protein
VRAAGSRRYGSDRLGRHLQDVVQASPVPAAVLRKNLTVDRSGCCFGLGEVSWREDGWGLTLPKTAARDSTMADPRVLNERDASLFVVE